MIADTPQPTRLGEIEDDEINMNNWSDSVLGNYDALAFIMKIDVESSRNACFSVDRVCGKGNKRTKTKKKQWYNIELITTPVFIA